MNARSIQPSSANMMSNKVSLSSSGVSSGLSPEEITAYVDRSLMRFEELSRASNQLLREQWAEKLLDDLTPYVDGLQSAIYFYETHPEPGLYFTASYALDPKDLRPFIQIGHGLSGQVAKIKRATYLRNGNGVRIAGETGTADIKPAGLLAQPLCYDNELEGVLEMTSIYGFTDAQLIFISRLCDNIAANLRFQRIQKQMTLELENQVKDRTQDLELALRNVQDTQQQLVLSEKMATLGQLVAGVAHEINTPIGAIKTSAGNIELDFNDVVNTIPEFFRQLTEEQLKRFRSLLALSTSDNNSRILSNQEERSLRKSIKSKLDALNIKDAQGLSRQLVDVGLANHVDETLKLVNLETEASWFQVLYIYSDLNLNIRNIITAVDKTSKIVFTLKSYAYKSSGSETVMVSLRENIDIILTLYQSQFKQGVELILEIDDVFVEGNSDELGQIWTNIIHNGLQAMKFKGKMEIKVSQDSEKATVIIADNGPGIPQDVQARIFEPFFTTKIKGEGTGLGLSLVTQIIKRHNGTISVQSKPGDTRFIIELPLHKINNTNQ